MILLNKQITAALQYDTYLHFLFEGDLWLP